MTTKPVILQALRAGAFLPLCLALAACSSDDSPNGPSGPNSGLSISPGEVELEPGASQQLQATAYDANGAVIPSVGITWSTTNSAVATVSGSGVVTGVAIGTARIVASGNSAVDTAIARVTPLAPTTGVLEVYPEVTYQVMTGWEGSAQIGEVDCGPSTYHQEVLNRLVNELGINRVRLHIRSGHENPTDYYTPYRNTGNAANWNPRRYESVNDNSDPRVANLAGFQFAEIDHKVEAIINPLRALLQARGERLYVNLNYVDFGVASWEQSSDPEEYAELVQVMFQHLRSRYGWVPDAVEMILEPDNTNNWNAQAIGKAIVATGDRLKALGIRPDFIAPSSAGMNNALTDLPRILAVPRVLEYLTDVAYHRYGAQSVTTVAAISERAREYGLRTSMLEKIQATDRELHEDLKEGRNSAWQQFGLAYCGNDTGGHYYGISTSASTVVLTSRARTLRQYFAFIRSNAVRVGAVSGEPRLDPLAFRNANGKLVVVVRASASAPLQLRRLPPGTYGLTLTTGSQTFASLPDLTVGAAGTLQATMPAAGVITIYQR